MSARNIASSAPAKRRSARLATGTSAVCGCARSSGAEKSSSGWMRMSMRSAGPCRLRAVGRGRRSSRSAASSSSSCSGSLCNGSGGLRIFGIEAATARAEMRETLGNFGAPIGFVRQARARIYLNQIRLKLRQRPRADGFCFLARLRHPGYHKKCIYRSHPAGERHTSSIFVSLVVFAPRRFQWERTDVNTAAGGSVSG